MQVQVVRIQLPLMLGFRLHIVGHVSMAHDERADVQVERSRFLLFLLREGVNDELEVGWAVRRLFVERRLGAKQLRCADVHPIRQQLYQVDAGRSTCDARHLLPVRFIKGQVIHDHTIEKTQTDASDFHLRPQLF